MIIPKFFAKVSVDSASKEINVLEVNFLLLICTQMTRKGIFVEGVLDGEFHPQKFDTGEGDGLERIEL